MRSEAKALFTPEEIREMEKADREINKGFVVRADDYKASNDLDQESLEERQEASRQRYLERRRRYYRKNREKILAANAKYQAAHREEIRAYKAAYYQSHKLQHKQYKEGWYDRRADDGSPQLVH